MRRALVLTLAIPLAAAGTAAQQPAPATPEAAAKSSWQVDWASNRCVLTRMAGNQPSFSIRVVPGAVQSELMLSIDPAALKVDPAAWSKPGANKAIVELQPAGFRSEMLFGMHQVPNSPLLILALPGMEKSFLTDFAKAEQVSISLDTAKSSFSLRSASKAVEALQKCVDDVLVQNGLDPKTVAGLREQPQGDWRTAFTFQDYPSVARRARKTGSVMFSAVVDTEGKVSKCSVVQGSGTKELDDKTCSVLQSKARFKPAIGADGSAAKAPVIDTMVWDGTMTTQNATRR